jgi:hypothetical protein
MGWEIKSLNSNHKLQQFSRGDIIPADNPRIMAEKPVVHLLINALGLSSPAAD